MKTDDNVYKCYWSCKVKFSFNDLGKHGAVKKGGGCKYMNSFLLKSFSFFFSFFLKPLIT